MTDESKRPEKEITVGMDLTESSRRSNRLFRVWLIVLTTLSSLVCILTGVVALATSAVLLFLFEDPNLSFAQALLIQVGIWLATITLVSLLGFGVVGGWRAFHKGSRKRSLRISLLTLPPIFFCILGILFLIITGNPVLSP